MIQPIDEQEIVTRCAQADGRLMQELAATHGLEFAAAFRIEYANEVAHAIRAIVGKSAGEDLDQVPFQRDAFRAQPGAPRLNVSNHGQIDCCNPSGGCRHWRHRLLQQFCRKFLHSN